MDKNGLGAIDLFWRTANFVSLSLLYLRSNPMLLRPLALEHVKPRIVGHWGSIPALNFIWANLLAAISTTDADVRVFLGTGHAGPAWLSCSYLEGSLSQYYAVSDDEVGLAWVASSFGRTGGFTTELSAQYPGVLWSSGELGYALGIAHGHSLSAVGSYVVAVLGDGEMETAPTVAAFQALRKFAHRRSRLIVVVNLNGFRMGGPSELSGWSDEQIRQYFGGLCLEPQFVDGFDALTLSTLLQTMFANPSGRPSPLLVFLRTPKGATTPCALDGTELVGTAQSHKAPIKNIRRPTEVAWLEAWFRSYQVERVFRNGELNRADFSAILPPTALLPGTARDRIHAAPAATAPHMASEKTAQSLTEAFVESVGLPDQNVLVTSPDELISNRLGGLAVDQAEVLEYLSEHQCLAWSIGAASAARPTWFTSYEAFAPVVTSMVTQQLKFLDSAMQGSVPLSVMPLNILLTSLGWRNVYSHQDPGFASSILEKRFHSFQCFLPTSTGSMIAAVRLCELAANKVNCVIADKYEDPWSRPATRLSDGFPFSEIWRYEPARACSAHVCILAAGDYIVREAVFAAEAVALASEHLTCRVIVLEELSWLYRDSPESQAHRSAFCRHVSTATVFVLATSLYAGVLSSLTASLLPRGRPFAAFGYCSNIAATTALGALFESQCSWMQIASNALELVLLETTGRIADDALRAVEKLRLLDQYTRKELAGRYDDPEWYWALGPREMVKRGRGDKTA